MPPRVPALFDPPTKTYFYFRPSIQVFTRRPTYPCRGDGVCSGPVRRAPAPPGTSRGAWRRSRSLAPRPRLSLSSRPREPTSEPTAKPTNAHRRGEREHAIAARDKANTQKPNAGRPGASPSASRRRSSAPTRPSTTASSGSRRGHRVRGAFTRVDGVGMDAVARRWRGGGRGR